MLIFFIIIFILILWLVGSYLIVRNIEKPVYKVLDTKDGYEIRVYQPYIVAQTTLKGDRNKALNTGFRIIADYIFGNNVTKSSIAMTSPVLERQESQKIKMTAPVLDKENNAEERVVSFVLPSMYAIDTLPVPNNPAVQIRQIDTQKVAVLRFGGYVTSAKIVHKKNQLKSMLERDDIKVMGEMTVAQYNPPFSMPLMRRNEIIVTIV